MLEQDDPTPELGVRRRMDRFALAEKARVLVIYENLRSYVNSLVLCAFVTRDTGPRYNHGRIRELLGHATGLDLSPRDMLTIGERNFALLRLFAARAGMGPERDGLPGRFHEPLPGGLRRAADRGGGVYPGDGRLPPDSGLDEGRALPGQAPGVGPRGPRGVKRVLVVGDEVSPALERGLPGKEFGKVDLLLSCGDLPYDYLEYLVDAFDAPSSTSMGTTTGRSRPRGGSSSPPGRDLRGRPGPGGGGLLVAGLGGSPRYEGRRGHQYTEGRCGSGRGSSGPPCACTRSPGAGGWTSS